jgi:hypothetical protein
MEKKTFPKGTPEQEIKWKRANSINKDINLVLSHTSWKREDFQIRLARDTSYHRIIAVYYLPEQCLRFVSI